ncbi:MAG: protein translocase subunit SecD [Halanaerobiales bacterium]
MKYKQKKLLKAAFIISIVVFAFVLYQMYGINLGLDLQGGSHIVLQAEPTEDREVNNEVMDGIQNIIERRVNQLGLSEPVIQREGNDRIIVELPAVDDPNEAIETIGRTAVLTFRNSSDEVLMRGDAVKDASAGHDDYGRPIVKFSLTSEGSQEFEEITREYMGQRIGIYLDDEELTNPQVNQVIKGDGSITGYETIEEAEEHAILIREGSLPVPVNVVERSTIGPSLGRIAIRKSIIAGLIGLLFVAVYMIIYYKFPGVLASLVLAIYGVLIMGTLAGFKATLTLPGVAGLILSIGMAVDANIIIFERIKDERQNGKTLRAAIDAGFKRAYMTIFDANVTTIITAIILAYFTSGTVRGFAVTLGIGIIISMFTAFIITRFVIDLFSSTDLLQNEASFGAKRR